MEKQIKQKLLKKDLLKYPDFLVDGGATAAYFYGSNLE